MATTIRAVKTGTIRIRPSHRATDMSKPRWRRRLAMIFDRDWTQPLPIYTYLIEHDEGLLLLDSGESARSAKPGWFPWLTNHDMDSGSPFAVILIGQPSLRQRLRLGVLAALDQRIAVRYHIGGMSGADTLFSEDAIGLIHNASRGHPRAVNNLALQALTAAFAADHSIVDEKAARIAITETATD
jgi:hypothetical protein